MLGRTGHGIWLHGLPKDTTERPLLDSDGCIVIDNESLLLLEANINPGQTLIVMSPDSITWIPAQSRRETRDGLLAALDAWKHAWEARDNDRYLAFYADDFSDLRRGKAAWSDYKRRVNDSKRSIRVEYTDLSMLQDPLHKDLVTVRYFQNYYSDNYNWSGWKEQLWRSTDHGWLIVYEGNG
jgi:murein L,D-transpeptidase YafK